MTPVLRRARESSAGRIAAALLGLLLSGAPRVVAQEAPAEGHRCDCRGHRSEQECDCALCRRVESASRERPACHGGPAAQERRSEDLPSRSAACVEGACGAGHERPIGTPGGADPSCPSALPSIPLHPLEREARPLLSPCGDADPRRPELPPPRPFQASTARRGQDAPGFHPSSWKARS